MIIEVTNLSKIEEKLIVVEQYTPLLNKVLIFQKTIEDY